MRKNVDQSLTHLEHNLYSFTNKTFNYIHLGLTWNCALQCSECTRTTMGEREKAAIPSDLFDWEAYKNLLDRDGVTKFHLCGNYGDPIYYKHLLRLCEYIKTKPESEITIHTNGSYKTNEFWGELATILQPEDTLVFSIDGTLSNSVIYRKGADPKSIQSGIQAVVDAPNRPQLKWKHLVFSYNIDTIEEAIDQAISLGFDQIEFQQPHYRNDTSLGVDWEVDDIANRIEYKFAWVTDFKNQVQIIMSDEGENEKWITLPLDYLRNVTVSSIFPKCMNQTFLPFVELDGTFVPCCWMSTSAFKIGKLKEFYGEDYAKLNLKNNSVDDIMQQWNKIIATWKTDTPLYNCVEACGTNKEDKLGK